MPEENKSNNVTIYTTSTCAFCKMAKKHFKENDVDYNEINVENNQEAQQEMMEKSGQLGVPVIDINGDIVVGFDKDKIDSLLGIEG